MALITDSIIQDDDVVTTPTPEIPVVPTSLNGMTDLINTNQTAQAQQLGVDPAGMAFINQQKAANLPQTEIGEQGLASLFPGMKHNINVGSYGGSILGSGNIYVPGGNIMAIDPILEKRKLEEAAKIKAAQDAAKNADFTLRKPKELQDKFYQESINKEANALNNEFLKVARDIYGEDYQQVIKNPQMFDIGREYLQKFDALDLLVGQGDQITTVLADMETASDKGEQVYSEETWKLKKEIESAINGDVKDLVGLRAKMQEFQGGKNFDEYLNKQGILDGIKGQVLGGTSIQPTDYEGYVSLNKSDKEIFDNNIKNLLDYYMSPNSPFAEEISKGLITRDMMEKRLRGSLQNKSVSTTKIANVSPKDDGSGGKAKLTDLDNIIGQPNTKTFTINTDGKPSEVPLVYNTTSEYKIRTRPDGKGSVNMTGLKRVLPDGTREDVPDIKEMTVVSFNGVKTAPIKGGGKGATTPIGSGSKWVKKGDTEIVEENVPVFIGKYKTFNESGEEVFVEGVFELDKTAIDALETDSDRLGFEKGFVKKAAEVVVKETKNANLAPSEQDVSKMTEEEKIQYYSNLE